MQPDSENILCTITTKSHLSLVMALQHSIQKHEPGIRLEVLVSDSDDDQEWSSKNKTGLNIRGANTVLESAFGKDILEKYSNDSDERRWSLKPVWLMYLLEENENANLLYVDNDIYFFQPFGFLFDTIADASIVLFPHWRIKDPAHDQPWFETNFKDGLYNAGVIGTSPAGMEALEWWANACLHKCEKDPANGYWDDQRYLDLIPAHFEDVHILQHRGCNVAYWNKVECPRTILENKVLIAEKWPIVFMHITSKLKEEVQSGEEALLAEFLKEYERVLSGF